MGKEEKFNIKKFFDFGGIAWATVLGLGTKVLLIVLLIFGGKYVLDKLFPPAPSNVTSPEITVESGGTASYTVIQQSETKRAWYIPSPFVEVFGEKTDKDEGINVGARFGARWEF